GGESAVMVSVRVQAAAAGSPEELDVLTRQLRQELLQLEVDGVALAHGDEEPGGAKGDVITIGTLVVTLANSAALAGACQVLRTWVTRDQGRRAMVKYGREHPMSLEITGANAAQHQQLIDSFLASMQHEQERNS